MDRKRAHVVFALILYHASAQAASINELLFSNEGLSYTCGTAVLPLQVSLGSSVSVNILDLVVNGYSGPDCSGTGVYSQTWSKSAPGAAMSAKTYYLCTNSLLDPHNSACKPGLQSMGLQMVNSDGFKSTQACQNVTCTGDVFTPTGTAWSNRVTESPGRVIGYLYGWVTPPSANAIAAAGYTHVLIAFGLFSTTSPGTINLDAISGFDLATYIQSLHDQGLKVSLSIGGASTGISDTTVDFDAAVAAAASPGAFITTFVNNMKSLVSTYGFDGFDFDIEHGLNAASSFTNPGAGCSTNTFNSACDIHYLATIINNFHTQSPSSIISLAPEIANISANWVFSSTWGNYASLIMQIRPAITWVGFQNYNSGCGFGINSVCYPTTGTLTSTADPAVAFSTGLLENWPQPTFNPYISLLSPSQVVIGYVAPNSSGVCDGSPCVIPSVAKNAITCLRSHQNCATYMPPNFYPAIGGVFAWSINYDADNNYAFATSLAPCVVSGNCS